MTNKYPLIRNDEGVFFLYIRIREPPSPGFSSIHWYSFFWFVRDRSISHRGTNFFVLLPLTRPFDNEHFCFSRSQNRSESLLSDQKNWFLHSNTADTPDQCIWLFWSMNIYSRSSGFRSTDQAVADNCSSFKCPIWRGATIFFVIAHQ